MQLLAERLLIRVGGGVVAKKFIDRCDGADKYDHNRLKAYV